MVALGDVVLEATGIEKYFGDHHVLRGVSLAVRKHETVMLIGRSGSGKTTFLRCLNFLEEPTVGHGGHGRTARRGRSAPEGGAQPQARTSASYARRRAWSSRSSTSSHT